MNLKLAEVARELARRNFHGDTVAAVGNLQIFAELFETVDEVTLETLNNDWSGAFVYLCTAIVGMGLPVRYPDPRVPASFASVYAWEAYARLPKMRLWHTIAEMPEVGDLVILEYEENKPPRMGVVLAIEDGVMELAVGNHRNHSAIIEQSVNEGVRGFVRMKTV
jgi:hypothetical protein